MGASNSRTDFVWSAENEPHAARRKEILSAHPEIKSLMVVDTNFKWVVLSLVFFQFAMAYAVSYFDFSWPLLFVITYVVSGTVNHSLLLAIHEIAHNAAFGPLKPKQNKAFGIFVNLPIGVPMSVAFKGYHLEHHKYQGHEVVDTDIPTELEAKLFTNTFGKTIWMILQPLFYALRPLIVYPKIASPLEVFNFAVEIAFDVLVVYYFGGKSLFYMIAGSLLGMGVHPVAGHFVSEHYMFNKMDENAETYSYYGPLNAVTFNVGYHNEHHDFPNIPGSLLPKVKEMAPEYYDHLPQHTSWVKVLYDYIMDPSVGPFARTKRKEYLYALEEKKKAAAKKDE